MKLIEKNGDINKTLIDWVVGVTMISVMCVMLWFICWATYWGQLNSHASILGRQTLSSRMVIEDTYWGVDFKTDFRSSEYGNTAFVRYAGTMKEFHDLNKSKIAGEWAGEKVKEAAGGFWKGIWKKSKHGG